MDMTEIDDKLLQQFFEPARQQQIEDNGFTERVLRRLPDPALQLSNWWTAFCLAIGLILFVVYRGWEPLIVSLVSLARMLSQNIHPIPFFMILGMFSCWLIFDLAQRMWRLQV
jgi:hypothetical protein